jgi:hypothetical protein
MQCCKNSSLMKIHAAGYNLRNMHVYIHTRTLHFSSAVQWVHCTGSFYDLNSKILWNLFMCNFTFYVLNYVIRFCKKEYAVMQPLIMFVYKICKFMTLASISFWALNGISCLSYQIYRNPIQSIPTRKEDRWPCMPPFFTFHFVFGRKWVSNGECATDSRISTSQMTSAS